MHNPLNLPASLLSLLNVLRPCFTAPGLAMFCGLAAGLAGQVRRRTVAGMLLGGGLQHIWPHDRAHYFFSRARWELDQLGLAVAQLAVMLLAGPDADLHVAVDDSVFRRCGRQVHGAGWQHDGSAPGMSKLSYGNCFVTAGLLVRLPFCARLVCLPVLARLHLPGKGTGPSKVETAAALVSQLALAFPERMIHVVADAAYHGPALRELPGNVTWTCRIPRNAVLYDLAPPRTGRRGRPRTRGDRLGTAAGIAAAAARDTVTVTVYGRDQVRHVTESQHYYEPVRQRIPHRYSAPRDFCRQVLSLSPPAAYRHKRQPADAAIGTRLPTFRAAAAEQARATSVPDRLASKRDSRQTYPGIALVTPVLMSLSP